MSSRQTWPGRDTLEMALGERLEDARSDQFAHYLERVLAARRSAGLTALDTPEAIVARHFAEPLALLALMRRHEWTAALLEDGARVADIGPGAGSPGVPMRLVAPTLRLTLIEAHGRRAAFLEELVRVLELAGTEVLHARAEDVGRDLDYRERFDLVVARAVAPLAVLTEYAVPLLRPGGVLVAPKGSGIDREVEEAGAALAALAAEVSAPVPLGPEAPVGEHAPEERPRVVMVRRVGALDDRYPRRAGIPSKRPLGRSRRAEGAR